MKRDSVSAYVRMKRDTPLPLQVVVRILDDPPPSPHQLRTYLIDDPFLNQRNYQDIRISYSLKYKRQKNKFLYEKINGSVE